MKYTGQAGRPFKTISQEHLQDFKYESNKSKFAQHLVDNRQATDPTKGIMETVSITNMGKMMGTIEIYFQKNEK